MNTRISQDADRQLTQLAQLSGGAHYFLEAPGPGDIAAYVADPSIRLAGWAANNRLHGIALQNELQNRTHAHRLSRQAQYQRLADAGGGSSARALSERHGLALPDMNRADLAGPFDTVHARLTDPAAQYRQTQTGHYFYQRPMVETRPALATPRLDAMPTRMRGDSIVR